MNGIVACVMRWLLGAALAGTWLAVPSFAADTIRLAVQKTGTVAWELAVIRAHGLDKEAGLTGGRLFFGTTQASRCKRAREQTLKECSGIEYQLRLTFPALYRMGLGPILGQRIGATRAALHKFAELMFAMKIIERAKQERCVGEVSATADRTSPPRRRRGSREGRCELERVGLWHAPYDYAKAREDQILSDARRNTGALGSATDLMGGGVAGGGLAQGGVTAARLLSSASSFAGRTLATAADAAGLGGLPLPRSAAIARSDFSGFTATALAALRLMSQLRWRKRWESHAQKTESR